MSGIGIAAAAAVFAAIFSVFVRRWLRTGRSDRLPIVWGLALIILSVIVGVIELPTEGAPKGEPESIGVVPPVEPAPGEGNGLSVALGVRLDDCGDRAEATLVTNGTAEYWRRHARRFPDAAKLQVALPGTDIREIRVGVSDDPAAVQSPATARLQAQRFLREVSERDVAGFTVVTATIDQWPKHLNSLVVRFRPDWVEDRSVGTCYVRLPTLTGALTVVPAQFALGATGPPKPRDAAITSQRVGRPVVYEPGLETTFGSATVVIDDGDILNEESRPSPDTTFEGHPTWVCETHPPRSAELDEDRGGAVPDVLSGSSTAGAAYSRAYARDARGTDCDGIAVIAENTAGTKRDLLLLGLGATVSLGAAIIVETLLGPAGAAAREKRPKPPRRRRRRGRRRN